MIWKSNLDINTKLETNSGTSTSKSESEIYDNDDENDENHEEPADSSIVLEPFNDPAYNKMSQYEVSNDA